MGQRFVTHSTSSEQEYTYYVSFNKVGAGIIHVLVVQVHSIGQRLLSDADQRRPSFARLGRGYPGLCAVLDSDVDTSCLHDDDQGRGQCKNGNKSSGGDDVHGGSKIVALMERTGLAAHFILV